MNLKSLYSLFFKHPEGGWIMKDYNAELLYEFIKQNNIHKVLELGTGIGASTAVMALAFQDKGEKDWHIDTIEQYQKCIDIAKDLIPTEMQNNITFYLREPEAIQFELIACKYFSVYKDLPEGDYDLILNDGPSPFVINDKFVDLPNGTIHKLTLENRIKTGTKIIYDGRKESLSLLERYFAQNYFAIIVPPKGNDFFVLERKDNELKVFDETFDAMKNLTPYFKEYKKNEKPSSEKV